MSFLLFFVGFCDVVGLSMTLFPVVVVLSVMLLYSPQTFVIGDVEASGSESGNRVGDFSRTLFGEHFRDRAFDVSGHLFRLGFVHGNGRRINACERKMKQNINKCFIK